MHIPQACVEDSVTPITLRLNFTLVGKPLPYFRNLQPMLATDAQRYFTASLPFEKNCGADHICQDDLGISFSFPGLKTLLVGSNLELNAEVMVWNDGEDSYGTTITFSHPAGLSYRHVAEGQVLPLGKEEAAGLGVSKQGQLRSLRLTCDSAPAGSQGIWSTSCRINHLIFRGGAQITFLATFDISPKAVLGDRLLLVANVSSENNTPRTSKTTFQLELPVKYTVYTVASRSAGAPPQAKGFFSLTLMGGDLVPCSSRTSEMCQGPLEGEASVKHRRVHSIKGLHEQSTKYFNFSASEEKESRVATHRYQAGVGDTGAWAGVNNLGQRDLPVSINFWVPVELNQEAVWTEVEISHPQDPSLQCSSEKIAPPVSDFLVHIQKNPVLVRRALGQPSLQAAHQRNFTQKFMFHVHPAELAFCIQIRPLPSNHTDLMRFLCPQDCSIAGCLRFRCDVPSFSVQEKLDFTLRGNLSFGWVRQTSQKKVSVVSVAEITFDISVYSQLRGQEAFMSAQTMTVLEKYKIHNPTPLIVGSSLGGLLLLALITATLYKVGFFKRQYKEMMEEANGQIVPENRTSDPQPAQ
ncbi:hypothetical protein P7K49_023391 [Saguinus oedipus]|uniref:Integrin alpha-X n=1 Tax=Saguinus oedipus TaxID=9490 RepID=A0ABQ9ULI1_SAGOE|nr:hypothetical protein P7K49_023391 [Saguinus oedipus]